MWVCQYEVHLLTIPSLYDRDEEQSKCLPVHDECVCVQVVDTILLLPAMHIQLSFPFVYLSGVYLSLSFHQPHHLQYFHALRDIFDWNDLPMVIGLMVIDFLLN